MHLSLNFVVAKPFYFLPRQLAQKLDVHVGSDEFSRQHLDLQLQFLNLLRLRVIVLDGSVADAAGLGSVLQSAVVFSEELVTRAQAGDHARKGVAADALAQQTG